MRMFFDVDTQNDFINNNGTLSVKAEDLKPNLEKLTNFALKNKILILGSVDRHFGDKFNKEYEGELSKWGGPFPDHCMNNTLGQKKIKETLLDALFVQNIDDFSSLGFKAPQIIFEKQSYDVFYSETNKGGNILIEPFLKQLEKYKKTDEVVVYGVATDYCVKAAVLGFLKRSYKVIVVKDAIKAVNEDTGREALFEMQVSGAIFKTTKEIIQGGE